MKIKIALLGLFFANGIMHPIYADQYEYPLKVDEIVVERMVENGNLESKKDEGEIKSENLIKWGTTVSMGPAMVYQDQVFSTENSFKTGLTCKADVPKAWCNKDATVHIGVGWSGKDLTVGKAAVTIGKMVTIGYTSSVFCHEKADPAWLISPDATVLQIRREYILGCLRIRAAIERPIPLQVRLFDKNKSAEKGAKKAKRAKKDKKDKKEEDSVNKLDEADTDPFNIKNSFPAIGLNLGVVGDQLNIGLSGLVRCTDYTHSTNPDEKDLRKMYYFTYGAHLGIQCQVVPNKFTVTGGGGYVHGLGDYLSGFAAIQNDEKRKEMCAAYYIDKGKDRLSSIDAWGFGGTLQYCATSKWTLSIRGSYLATVEDSLKPAQAFRAQGNINPEVAYAVNKYFTISSGYSLVKEFKIDQKEDIEHTLSGGLEFSL